MRKALADRLAEALAAAVYQHVRKDLWGYAPAETLDAQAMIAETYHDNRPASGYRACSDHHIK
jgi:5-methyltetrahydrofolate--homocysteine methyltransferase